MPFPSAELVREVKMKSWQLAVAALACLTPIGCRTDPNIALLERDLRLQEDEMYRLKECIEDYQVALQSCREEGADLPKRLGAADAESSPPAGLPVGPGTLVPPMIELPSQPEPGGEPPDTLNVPGRLDDSSDPLMPGPVPLDVGGPDHDAGMHPNGGTAPIVRADSRQVTQIAFSRAPSGGYDTDGRPGDEGVRVVLEPRDAQGRCLEAPADVSVVVYDPALVDSNLDDPALVRQAALVARWDLTAAETASLFQKAGRGRGMQLEMPWPADPPVHDQLHLFVRYTTSDGRKLQADRPIQITLPGEPSRSWVAAELTAPTRQASHTAEPQQTRPTPAARIPTSPSPHLAAEPAEPKIERPAWSPDRR